MSNPFIEKSIILGVTGSIAAYKAADLASKLAQNGARVTVILTRAAEQFISPITFQSVTGYSALTEDDLWSGQSHITHVQIAKDANLMIIAPASANTIAKIAHGIADNLLTVSTLALQSPLLIAPAMDAGMFSHIATQTNVETLKSRGVHFIGPSEGHLASGLSGKGRMVEVDQILQYSRWLLSREGPLKKKKILITAGGTQEPLDPVRILTNRSSGKQGYALVQAALDMGADVTLITTPTCLAISTGVEYLLVHTAEEMYRATIQHIQTADALIMAAAVADYSPIHISQEKIKKDKEILEISLSRTTDILFKVAKFKKENNPDLVVIGFAAESENLYKNALEKLEKKNLDLIIANDISKKDSGFAVDTNQVSIFDADGTCEELPLMPKDIVAQRIIQKLIEKIESKEG